MNSKAVNYSTQISHVVRNDKEATIEHIKSLTATPAHFDSRLRNVRNDKIETIEHIRTLGFARDDEETLKPIHHFLSNYSFAPKYTFKRNLAATYLKPIKL
ncbi:hypothetical protein [Pontibacter pudoricolor]|uniref:hypothetical protein n=1 Tax=Pontibacter pudoricolor TaxID=2694930 RepID=UPI001390CB67|nr:hypothetical protein [Pontibacter pudoricolor]